MTLRYGWTSPVSFDTISLTPPPILSIRISNRCAIITTPRMTAWPRNPPLLMFASGNITRDTTSIAAPTSNPRETSKSVLLPCLYDSFFTHPPPPFPFQTMVMFSIAVSMLTAPINLLVDFLFLDILAAPTLESLKKSQNDEVRAKMRAGIEMKYRSSTTSSKRVSDLDELAPDSNSALWFSNETRLLPSQTREAQFLASITSRIIVDEIWKKIEPPVATSPPAVKSTTQKLEEEGEEEIKSPLRRGVSHTTSCSPKRQTHSYSSFLAVAVCSDLNKFHAISKFSLTNCFQKKI
jgi:hypothetical protein